MVKTTYKYTKDKNLVWNQYTLFDLLRFIHSRWYKADVGTIGYLHPNMVAREKGC